ncbi:MAG TPA: PAS domain S-box protein [Gemmatimonadales bacterium]|nr:PAS domain S-box protein [Gemmatimonadales bacterium]
MTLVVVAAVALLGLGAAWRARAHPRRPVHSPAPSAGRHEHLVDAGTGEWQRIQATLQQTEARYRALIELTHTGYLILDGAGRVLDANDEYVRLTGRGSLAAILGRPVMEWTAPWDADRNAVEVRAALDSGGRTNLEVDYLHPDGTIVPVEINAAVIAPDRILSLCRDITTRRQAELRLRASEAEARARSEELARVLDTVPAVVWIARDRECREITGNVAAYQALRVDPGKNLSQTAPASDRPTHFRVLHDGREIPPERLPVQVAAAQGIALEGTEVSVVFEDGETTHLFGNVRPLWDDDGTPRGAVAAFVDISARKAAEANIRDVLESSPLPIVQIAADGRVTGWNAAAERTFGYTRAEAMDRYFPLVDGTLDAEHRAWRAEVFAGRAFSGRVTRRRHRDGRPLDVSVSTAPIRGSDGRITGLVAIYEDITERRELERVRQRLQERAEDARRLERLGVMAGGIAHDFNNLLTTMMGNIQIARDEIPTSSGAHEWLRYTEESIRRAVDLVAQMLSYAGQGPFAMAPLDLSALLADMTPVIRAELPAAARLTIDPADAAPPVLGDAAQLQKLVLQLVRNAAEALPERGGYITIRTGALVADGEYLLGTVLPEAFAPGPCAWLEVSDTGEGIPPEVMGRIFDPFFSTRFAGRGLGLAAVLGIARRHRGTVRVESAVGEGTRIRVLFPAATDALPRPADSPGPESR